MPELWRTLPGSAGAREKPPSIGWLPGPVQVDRNIEDPHWTVGHGQCKVEYNLLRIMPNPGRDGAKVAA
jgi:hypothetical protein